MVGKLKIDVLWEVARLAEDRLAAGVPEAEENAAMKAIEDAFAAFFAERDKAEALKAKVEALENEYMTDCGSVNAGDTFCGDIYKNRFKSTEYWSIAYETLIDAIEAGELKKL